MFFGVFIEICVLYLVCAFLFGKLTYNGAEAVADCGTVVSVGSFPYRDGHWFLYILLVTFAIKELSILIICSDGWFERSSAREYLKKSPS